MRLVKLVELCTTMSSSCPFIHSEIHTELDTVDTKTEPKQTDVVAALVGWSGSGGAARIQGRDLKLNAT